MTPDEINALRKWAQRHAHMKFLHVSVPISQLLALLTIAERAEGLRAAAQHVIGSFQSASYESDGLALDALRAALAAFGDIPNAQ